MASLVLGVAGAVVGTFFGNPALGYMIGSSLGAALFPPAGANGPRISDLKVQSSQYGSGIAIVYNEFRCSGTVIWAADLVEHKEQTDSGSGGGGTTNYTYTCSFAVSICLGPKKIRKIWADGKLIYDETGYRHFTATGYAIYYGDEGQLPDPTMEAALGAGHVPGYRGQAYMVFTDLSLGKFGNRIPNLSFAVGPLDGVEPLNLAQIVTDISNRVGIGSDLLVMESMEAEVKGYALANVMPGRSAIDPLANLFFFEGLESSGKIKFVKRGSPPAVIILNEDTIPSANASSENKT